MEREIKVGDIVMMKSGSRPMTVIGFQDRGGRWASVVWQNANGKNEKDLLPVEALVIYAEEEDDEPAMPSYSAGRNPTTGY